MGKRKRHNGLWRRRQCPAKAGARRNRGLAIGGMSRIAPQLGGPDGPRARRSVFNLSDGARGARSAFPGTKLPETAGRRGPASGLVRPGVPSGGAFGGAAWVPSAVSGAAIRRRSPLLSGHKSVGGGVSSGSDSSLNLRVGRSAARCKVRRATGGRLAPVAGANIEHDYVALDAMIVDYLLDAMTGLYEPKGDLDDDLRPERVAASPALLLSAASGHHVDASAPRTGDSRSRAPLRVRSRGGDQTARVADTRGVQGLGSGAGQTACRASRGSRGLPDRGRSRGVRGGRR